MRLNRGTLLLIVLSIGIIAVAMLVNNSQINAPEAILTPTGETVSAPLFPELDAGKLVNFEVRDNVTESFMQLGRSADETGAEGELLTNWVVTDATNAQDIDTDPTRAQTLITNFAALQSVTSFTLENELSAFGLDAPLYTLTATDATGNATTLQLGVTNNANRTYAMVNENAETVYVIRQSDLQPILDTLFVPPYLPTPTPTATATNTPNPYSEVEQTQTAVIEQTSIAATLEAQATQAAQLTPEVTSETTPEATP